MLEGYELGAGDSSAVVCGNGRGECGTTGAVAVAAGGVATGLNGLGNIAAAAADAHAYGDGTCSDAAGKGDFGMSGGGTGKCVNADVADDESECALDGVSASVEIGILGGAECSGDDGAVLDEARCG